MNAKELTVALQNSDPLPTIRYVDTGEVVPDIEPSDELTVHPMPPEVLTLTAQVTVASAYEGVSNRIKAIWRSNPHVWPPLLQYFRHVRNAAAHRNVFRLRSYKGVPAIDPAHPPKWRTSVIPDDSSINGLTLIGDWWDMGDAPVFLGDVDSLLRSSGINPLPS